MKKLLLFFVVSFQLLNAQLAPICFSQATLNTLPGTDYFDFVSEDFTGDGLPDIVACSGSLDNILLLAGDGQGNFSQYTSTFLPAGHWPYNLVAGDFNSDGKMDVVTVNSFSNTVSLLLGTGTGSFLAPTSFSIGNFAKSIITADFNNDGKPDIATGNYSSGNISVLISNGNGLFQPAVNYQALTGVEAITCGDYNNDGKIDIAAAVWTSAFLKVLYGNGNGTFQPFVDNPMYTFTNYPEAMISADFNNDGYDDVIIHDWSNALTAFYGTSTNSMSAYASLASATGGANTHIMAAGDINGDGKVDLVTKSNFYLGNGTGSLVVQTSYTAPGSSSAMIKDFNLDGKPDLGLIAPDLYIALNQPLLKISSVPAFICPGYGQVLNVSGASSYVWSTSQTGSAITVSPGTTTTYTVVGAAANGCVNMGMVTVSVVASPDSADLAFITIDSTMPDTICEGDQTNICVLGATNFSWSTGSNAACIYPTPVTTSQYYVIAQIYGCSKPMSYTQYVTTCTGITEMKGNLQLSIYPNPSRGQIEIEVATPLQVTLSDQLGRVIIDKDLTEGKHTLNLEDQPAGIYLLRAKSKNQETTIKKIILQP